MIKSLTKGTIYTMLAFIIGILLLGYCMFQEFNILDLGYAIVLVVYFIRYTWIKTHED